MPPAFKTAQNVIKDARLEDGNGGEVDESILTKPQPTTAGQKAVYVMTGTPSITRT